MKTPLLIRPPYIAGTISLFLMIFSALGCFGVTAIEPTITGNWSEPVGGVRGRLLFGEDAKFDGMRIAVIYLELQNVSDMASPKYIFHKLGPVITTELFDAAGQSIPQSGGITDMMLPPAYEIALPSDSTIRFRVSLSGFVPLLWKTPKDGGLLIVMGDNNWFIPITQPGDYFLSGTFTVDPPAEKPGYPPRLWKGALKLPQLKISMTASPPS